MADERMTEGPSDTAPAQHEKNERSRITVFQLATSFVWSSIKWLLVGVAGFLVGLLLI